MNKSETGSPELHNFFNHARKVRLSENKDLEEFRFGDFRFEEVVLRIRKKSYRLIHAEKPRNICFMKYCLEVYLDGNRIRGKEKILYLINLRLFMTGILLFFLLLTTAGIRFRVD